MTYEASYWTFDTGWITKGHGFSTVEEAIAACEGGDNWRVEDEDGNKIADQDNDLSLMQHLEIASSAILAAGKDATNV